jgi:hypothetical protein
VHGGGWLKTPLSHAQSVLNLDSAMADGRSTGRMMPRTRLSKSDEKLKN